MFSRLIQYVSRDLRSSSDHCVFSSIQYKMIFSNEWPDSLKCAATGDLLNLRVFQSDLCRFMRMFNAIFVSPTYCLLHILHVIRYTAFAVLQLWLPLMDEMAPDVALNVFDGRIILHVWHRLVPHGFDSPRTASSDFGVILARTRMSLILLGLLYAKMGCSGNKRLSLFDFSIVVQWRSMMFFIFGSPGW